MSDLLQSAQHGRVLRLALNRPEKRNALHGDLCRELAGALEDAGRDPRVGAIVLTGNGKSFCAGMDLDEIARGSTAEISRAHERLFTVGARLTTPLIAAVGGAALGGGAGLVANCHIVIADVDATFGLTEIRLGLWPFLVFRAVAAALGERRTVELSLTGRIFGPNEAREMGLVHQVAPAAERRAMEVAQAIASFSPTAIRSGMGFVHRVRGQDWETAGRTAREIRDEVFQGADFQEGIAAFREKRAPLWPSATLRDGDE